MKQLFKLLVMGLCLTMIACSTSGPREKIVYREVQVPSAGAQKAPGVVDYIWEEPMVNAVEVPPGLDPEGIYYRPYHQEIVEIRQGRWKPYNDQNQGPQR